MSLVSVYFMRFTGIAHDWPQSFYAKCAQEMLPFFGEKKKKKKRSVIKAIETKILHKIRSFYHVRRLLTTPISSCTLIGSVIEYKKTIPYLFRDGINSRNDMSCWSHRYDARIDDSKICYPVHLELVINNPTQFPWLHS